VIIKDNDIPGDPFDYDLPVMTGGVHPKYKYMHRRPPQVKGGTGAWKAFLLIAFGVLCFGVGVSVGSDDTKESVTVAASPSSVATVPTPTVIETVAVPTVPASCMLAFEQLAAMQGDLEIVIDSSQTQVVINNQAYVAIVAKKVEDITKATQAQYDLKRQTSHATLQLQEKLMGLKQALDSCKTDLDR